jgi:hypothetical protein
MDPPNSGSELLAVPPERSGAAGDGSAAEPEHPVRPVGCADSTGPAPVASPEPTAASSHFPLFQKLPCELRLAVWQMALQRPRRVHLHGSMGLEHRMRVGDDRGLPKPYTLRNWLGNLVSGQVYFAKGFSCALMAVSHEARAAADKFYSMKLPVAGRLVKWPDGEQGRQRAEPPKSRQDDADGTARAPSAAVWLSPEWDYIQFSTNAISDVFDCLYDLRAHDGKGLGVQNWAIQAWRINMLSHACRNMRSAVHIRGTKIQPSPLYPSYSMRVSVSTWRHQG